MLSLRSVEKIQRKVNAFYGLWDRHYPAPILWDVDRACPELRILEEHFPLIQKEADYLLTQRESIPTYKALDPYVTAGEKSPGKWQVFMLKAWKTDFKKRQSLCPETSRLLKYIPSVFQAFFSIMDPFKYIPPHQGMYKGYLRYHLGVKIPTFPRRPHLIVEGETLYWEEGKGFLFDDYLTHEAFNDTSKPRVVLIVDILRPRPLIPDLVNRCILSGFLKPFFFKRVFKSK
jgi:aspartyl/asparaginyl beta-hydroxylase (cupin superfamily)